VTDSVGIQADAGTYWELIMLVHAGKAGRGRARVSFLATYVAEAWKRRKRSPYDFWKMWSPNWLGGTEGLGPKLPLFHA
jgi:hypothetical protein